jgi:hypothetical protein
VGALTPEAGAVPLVLQTEQERHLENRLYPRGVREEAATGLRHSFCGQSYRLAEKVAKLVRVPLIPAAAICPSCTAVARQWYADYYFEPFDCVQRRRLLAVLTVDLSTVR